MSNGILVFAEQREGVLNKTSYEAIAAGQALAGKLGQTVSAVILGSGVRNLAEDLAAFELSKVIYAENDKPQNSAALISELQSLGYQLYWHLPPFYLGNNFYANPENPFGHTVSVNMLGIHSAFKSDIKGLRPVEGPNSDWRGTK